MTGPGMIFQCSPVAQAGAQGEPAVQRAIEYIRGRVKDGLDPYVLALAANALVAVDPKDEGARKLLENLVARAESDPKGNSYWRSSISTFMGGGGDSANIETTALAVIALLRSGQHPEVAESALNYLVSQRDRFGAYHTTQSTVLALKALTLAAQMGGSQGGDAKVGAELAEADLAEADLGDGRRETLAVTEENATVVQQVRFDDLQPGRAYDLALSVSGKRGVQYQVITEYYVPWSDVAKEPAGERALRIDVTYDRSEITVNDTVGVTAEVELLAEGQAGMVLVDLGVPPGFTPLSEDLDRLVEDGTVDRYELTGRQILFYLTDVPQGEVYRLEYRLQARFPLRAQAPASQAYDYYTPQNQDTRPPQRITVKLGTPQ